MKGVRTVLGAAVGGFVVFAVLGCRENSRVTPGPDAGVPVDAGVPPCQRPSPPQQPEWTAGRYFPQFPAATHIYALPVATDLEDQSISWQQGWQISDAPDTMHALTLVGMQGTINRETPCVYLEWQESLGVASAAWETELAKHVEIEHVNATGAAAVDFLYTHFSDRFAGAVVYDPQIPDTINVAMMVAGLEDRVVLAPQQLGQPGIPEFSSIDDLRTLAVEQGWDATDAGKTQIYQWVYDNLWPQLEKRILGVVSPGPASSGVVPGATPTEYYPLGIAARDYLVALRASALWLSPQDSAQGALLDKFLADAPSPIPLTGGYDEATIVSFGAQHGDWQAAITWPNAPLTAGNLTAIGAVPLPVTPYVAELNADRILATLGPAPVATIVTSDGDNLGFQMERGFWGTNGYHWDMPQGHRVAWTINPTLADLAPLAWNYYVDSANEVTFVAGLAGAGYTDPTLMDATQLGTYLDRTRDYLQRTGLRAVHIGDTGGDSTNPPVAQTYYDQLKGSGYLGAFTGYGGSAPLLGFVPVYEGVPAPSVAFATYPSIDAVLADVPGRRLGDFTVRLAAWPALATEFGGVIVADASAPGGTAVQFASTLPTGLRYRTYPQTLLAGSYTVAFSFKVLANASTASLVHIYALDSSSQMVAEQYLTASEFAQPGQWQIFTISFPLTAVATDVDVRFDGFNGVTDFSASTIQVSRPEPDPVPLFMPLFMNLVTSASNADIPVLADQLQAAGVVVVTPDEFMAALNPEFLIAFAEPRLGSGNSTLAQAKTQLQAGQFTDALLSVRAALAGH
jgi:hypothetical protein